MLLPRYCRIAKLTRPCLGFYQETGRAGRDGQVRSFVARAVARLTYDLNRRRPNVCFTTVCCTSKQMLCDSLDRLAREDAYYVKELVRKSAANRKAQNGSQSSHSLNEVLALQFSMPHKLLIPLCLSVDQVR